VNRVVPSIALGLCIAIAGFAQFELASVVGTVKDPTGLPIPQVTVEIRSLATNITRNTMTSAAGDYDFVALQPGQYSISAKQPGFKGTSRTFDVSVGQRLQLDISMEMGTATESVTVDANVIAVEAVSSDMNNVRTRQQVIDLPLNNRNFTQLVQLAPGVTNKGSSTNVSNGGYTAGRGTSGATINGNSSDVGIYLFDGIQSVDADANVLIFYPPVDAIQEFKVQTNAAPATYGGGPSVINVTFRSGTNELHGAAYEFVRNSAFDAKNFFDSASAPIPPFRMNEFGANLGGPVYIPRLFNGKNRLFFFADYEGKRVSQAQTYISTVPTAAMRTGDFSELLPRTIIRAPGTNVPLPNNRVASIDPVSAKIVNLYPLPNISGAGTVSNYLYNGPLLNRIDQGDVRIDYRTTHSSIFGRFSREDPTTTNPGFLPAPAIGGGPGYPGVTLAPGTQVVLGYGRSIGPSIYYELRAGFSRLVEDILVEDTKLGNIAEQLGIRNANLGGPGMSTISISGMASFGDGNGSLQKVNNIYEVAQALSWVRGKHELKFGFNWMTTTFGFFTPPKPVGSYSFNGSYTGYGLSDFLYGHPISSQIDITKYFTLTRYRPVLYVQDNWRLTSKLTLNLGLRDEMVTPWKERHNRLAVFDPKNGGDLVPVGTPGYPEDTVTDGHFRNLGPRVGFAYSVTPSTVIRAGFGIFYAYQTYNSNPQAKNAPYNGSLIVANAAGEAGYAAALPISAGFPASRPDLFPAAGTACNVFQRAYPNPSADEWHLHIQRQLSNRSTLSVAYVAQNGVHILINPNINYAVPGPGPVASRRPYPNLADGTLNCTCANSSFNSLQVTYLNRHFAGLDLQGAYAYAHSIDNSSGNSNGVGIQNPANLRLYRGNSDFDIRHNLVLSWTYELPFGRGKRFAAGAGGLLQAVIGGWRLHGIDTFATGSPFTPVMVSSLLNSGSAAQWPNRIGPGTVENRAIQRWYNPGDFVSPGNYTFGNSGRNILFGPGTKQFDTSVFKEFYFSENAARHLQFRAEAFNVLNTPQFNNPNAQIGNPAAGTITSAGAPLLFQRTSRQIQLALKLYW
jgi:hypothetical protein